ncbi:MAG TPA: hypothetical protein VKT82_28300 [Ktedonobacterales bacterium]|nr:hypothetical protein [Ktedonobacterales bacterium]
MARQAASPSIFRNLVLIFLIFFAFFALLNTGLSFIYQPLFALLISVPTFTMLAVFALLMTFILRQSCVEQVPSNTIGVVCYANGTLKTLAPAGPTWVWIGREQLSGLLSLAQVSTHAPLLGLKSGDGIELAPLVTIITWRIHGSITTLLDTQYRPLVIEVVTQSQGKRERRVRDAVAEAIGRRAMYATLKELEEELPNTLYNGFGQAVIADANETLTPMGLKVEKLECIGSVTIPTKASAAVKTLGVVRQKLESLLAGDASNAPAAAAPEGIDRVLSHARLAVQEMQAASRAVDAYVQAVINVLEHAHQHFKTQAGIQEANVAQKAQSKRLTELAAEINALLEAANEIKGNSKRARTSPAALTEAERDILFKVLAAIEEKRVSLGSIFA